MNDEQLNDIIMAPRPETSRLNPQDILNYFDTCAGTYKASWEYMEPKRMKEIFNRALNCAWCNAHHRKLIEGAFEKMNEKPH